jgi:hypothetical protein
MPILTRSEVRLLTGKAIGSGEDKRKALLKIELFQRDMSDSAYVQAIDRLIPAAEKAAIKAAKKGGNYNHTFHSEMKKRARKAGLRQ